MLVRFARRKTSWERALSVEELQKIEFRTGDGSPDLRPSVYDLEATRTHLVRAYAEHATAFDPPKAALALDVTEPPRETEVTPGSPAFSFIRERHREIVIRDSADLHAFIGELVVNVADRRQEVTSQEAKDYASSRLRDGDEEWVRAANADGAQAWLVKLRDQ